jgi:hypothetical protein
MLHIVKRGFSTESLSKALSTQKVAELKQIATQSGVISSGKKSELVDRLVNHFHSLQNNKEETKKARSSVLSFDLGYRNLAYCHLSRDAKILDWARVDLDLPSFHPSVIAPVVRQFIRNKVLNNLKVADMVLVEQQRARSGGSFAVLESTLRVNCVEAVLWGGLCEAADLVKRPELKMAPLIRQSVDRVWQAELDAVILENPQRFSKIKAGYYHKKQAGSLLVQKWLDTNTVVNCSEEFKTMFGAEKKKDDLSDCLIQALAWYKWERFSKNYIENFIDE